MRNTYEVEDLHSTFNKVALDFLMGRSHQIRGAIEDESSLSRSTPGHGLAHIQTGPAQARERAWSSDDEDSMITSPIKSRDNNNGMKIFELLETNKNEEIKKWIENLLEQYELEQIMNRQGLGLLHVACQNDNIKIVEFIISKSREYTRI